MHHYSHWSLLRGGISKLLWCRWCTLGTARWILGLRILINNRICKDFVYGGGSVARRAGWSVRGGVEAEAMAAVGSTPRSPPEWNRVPRPSRRPPGEKYHDRWTVSCKPGWAPSRPNRVDLLSRSLFHFHIAVLTLRRGPLPSLPQPTTVSDRTLLQLSYAPL